ncbi:MAG TPA: hypothetical protein VND64_28810 [Pirellulales bacterium]|nr:hypothetical protein [Pirellulales bacterium]
MSNTPHVIEFFGGPLDGNRSEVPALSDELESTLEVRISRNTFQVMEGKPPRPAAIHTSTAIYELNWGRGLPAYHFVRARSVFCEAIGQRRTLAGYFHSALQKIIGKDWLTHFVPLTRKRVKS